MVRQGTQYYNPSVLYTSLFLSLKKLHVTIITNITYCTVIEWFIFSSLPAKGGRRVDCLGVGG